jgi:MFS family permease
MPFMIRRPIFYGWYVVAACFAAAAYVAGTVFFGFTAFIEPIVREFGWSYTTVSLIAAIRGLNMGLFAPVAGVLVDRFGSRKIVLTGFLIMTAGMVLLSQTNSLFWFFCCFLLLSFGAGGCTSVVLMTLTANWFDRHVGKAMGLVACGFGAGGALVPINVLLIDALGWRGAVLVLGAGMLAIGLPIVWIIRNRPDEMGLRPDGEAPLPADAEPSIVGAAPAGMGFSQGIRSRTFWQITGSEIVRMLVVAAVVMHIMPYLGSVGFDRATAGLITAGIPIISIFGRLGLGWLGDVFSKKYIMAANAVSMAVGLLVLGFIDCMYLAPVFLLFFAVGFGGNVSLRGAIIRHYFGTAAFGRLLGVTMGASSLGGIIGPVAAGYTFDTFGTYQPVWLVFFVLSLLAAVPFLLIREKDGGR